MSLNVKMFKSVFGDLMTIVNCREAHARVSMEVGDPHRCNEEEVRRSGC